MMLADLLVKSLANIADIVGLANLVLSPSHIIFRPGIEKGRKKGRERAVLSFLILSPQFRRPKCYTQQASIAFLLSNLKGYNAATLKKM
jgi:hypothetical protein